MTIYAHIIKLSRTKFTTPLLEIKVNCSSYQKEENDYGFTRTEGTYLAHFFQLAENLLSGFWVAKKFVSSFVQPEIGNADINFRYIINSQGVYDGQHNSVGVVGVTMETAITRGKNWGF